MGSLLENQIAQAVFSGLKTGGLSLKSVLYRPVTAASAVLDDNGEPINPVPLQYACEGFQDNYKPFIRARDGIPDTDLKVCLYGASFPAGIVPQQDDIIHMQNQWYQLREDVTDPAEALWECRAFVIPAPVAAAAISASSPLLEGGISRDVYQGLKIAGLALDATLYRPVTSDSVTLDLNGEPIDPVPASYACQGFTDKIKFKIRRDGVPDCDTLVCIYGWSLPGGVTPEQDDKVNIRNKWYQLRKPKTDPAKALWECEAFLTTAPIVAPVEIIGIVTQRFKAMTQSAMAGQNVAATISQTFNGVSQSVVAFQPSEAVLEQTFNPMSQSLSGGQFISADINQSFGSLIQVAMSGQYISATSDQAFSPMSQDAFAYQSLIGSISQSFQSVTQLVLADTTGRANIYQTFSAMTQEASAGQYVTASVSQSFQGVTQDVRGNQYIASTVQQSFASLSQDATANQYVSADVYQSFSAVTQLAEASEYISAEVEQSFNGLSQSLVATQVLIGAMGQTFSSLTQSITAGQYIDADVQQSFSSLTQALEASQQSALAGDIAQTFSAMTQSAAAKQVLRATVTQSFGSMTQSAVASGTPWTPANLSVTPYMIADPATFVWSGSNFSSGSNANPGSIGGNFVTALGTPTKSAGDNNGYDAIQMAANSGFGIASAVVPAGNMFCMYVSKRLGNPANSLGAILSQSAQTPGWALYDEINLSTSLSNGHQIVPGDVGWNGWPSGTTNTDKDIIAHPPTDDGMYHINCAMIGTSHLWNYDGTDLIPTYYTDHSVPTATGNLIIGTSTGGQNYNGRLGYLIFCPPPPSGEISKLQGWAAWKYGLTSKLPSGHPYKNARPFV